MTYGARLPGEEAGFNENRWRFDAMDEVHLDDFTWRVRLEMHMSFNISPMTNWRIQYSVVFFASGSSTGTLRMSV